MMQRFIKLALIAFLGSLLVTGCSLSKPAPKGQDEKMKSQGAAGEPIKNPELKHLLDHRKQQRQLEHDLQIKVRDDEIKQKTYSTPQPKKGTDSGQGSSSKQGGGDGASGNKKKSTGDADDKKKQSEQQSEQEAGSSS